MLGIKVKTEDQMNRLKKSADKAAAGNIYSAASLVRKSAMDSIERSADASAPGQPPNTRRRQLPRSILFAVGDDKKSAIIGPRASFVGQSAQAHEFGGDYKGQEFPERPFMFPALDRTSVAFGGSFAGSIGE